ncbi:MAG: NUDIX domain-containing protein [Gemmatimonadota bacterium]
MNRDDNSAAGTRIRAGIVDLLVLAPDESDAGTHATVDWRVLVLRRGPATRCTGAWEIVHGRIESGERPDAAALRELAEETGLEADRLYSITVNPFYLVATDAVELAIVFAALVERPRAPTLGDEHDAWEWVTPATAMARLAWPRERDALAQALSLLATGDAGPVDDVLRVR